MTDGQAQLQTTDRHNGVRGITLNNQQMSCEVFSTDRVFLQQQQADHHDVDICPDSAVFEKTGNLQKESCLVKQQYWPALVQLRDSEILAGVSAVRISVVHVYEPYIKQETVHDHFQARLGMNQSGCVGRSPSDLTSGLTLWKQFRVRVDSWGSAAKS